MGEASSDAGRRQFPQEYLDSLSDGEYDKLKQLLSKASASSSAESASSSSAEPASSSSAEPASEQQSQQHPSSQPQQHTQLYEPAWKQNPWLRGDPVVSALLAAISAVYRMLSAAVRSIIPGMAYNAKLDAAKQVSLAVHPFCVQLTAQKSETGPCTAADRDERNRTIDMQCSRGISLAWLLSHLVALLCCQPHHLSHSFLDQVRKRRPCS